MWRRGVRVGVRGGYVGKGVIIGLSMGALL